jgi:antitoxin component YwqK of YwqJK toxin-antitoxin module
MNLSIMIKLVILFNLFPFQIFSQDSIVSEKTLTFDFQGSCDKNFSEIKLDSTFTNFYIINYKDTIFFKDNTCMISRQTTSPTTFITRVKGGYAEGFLRIFTSSDLSYSILDANFSNGHLIDGNSFEYYNSGKIKLTGQYLGGRPFGTWTTYYESGQVQRIVTYDQREYIKLIEYEENGVVIENYDYFEEKAKYK